MHHLTSAFLFLEIASAIYQSSGFLVTIQLPQFLLSQIFRCLGLDFSCLGRHARTSGTINFRESKAQGTLQSASQHSITTKFFAFSLLQTSNNSKQDGNFGRDRNWFQLLASKYFLVLAGTPRNDRSILQPLSKPSKEVNSRWISSNINNAEN
ncbi:hypothetical protein OWV82_006797 [Melia azedarach]|uniref:Uncharacterized protein n=1 Tax=Melia azedarach TaxID=155640 RepID=A0ACC1YK56_MELAZ|nr:hypothetical protein OWV82_006797 [Melia azedarach]